jgi:hypothetical protein
MPLDLLQLAIDLKCVHPKRVAHRIPLPPDFCEHKEAPWYQMARERGIPVAAPEPYAGSPQPAVCLLQQLQQTAATDCCNRLLQQLRETPPAPPG